MMQHSCCKDCEPGKSRKTIENNEKVFDANKDTMVQYSCSAVCEPGKLGKIENHEKVNGFEVMASCSMTQTTTKPAGFFRAFRTKLNRFLALVETADLKSFGSS
jgi:hypothetical protein